ISNGGASASLQFNCTINSLGELTWTGDANGTYAATSYDFQSAISPSILACPTTTGVNVVQWAPGPPNSNTDAIPVSTFGSNQAASIFALEGGTSVWERHDPSLNTWTNGVNPLPAANGPGAALVYDGQGFTNGFAYALRGNNTTGFARYALNVTPPGSGTWSARAATPGNVGAGGALTAVTTSGVVSIYALQGGGSTAFWRYNPASNTWTTL